MKTKVQEYPLTTIQRYYIYKDILEFLLKFSNPFHIKNHYICWFLEENYEEIFSYNKADKRIREYLPELYLFNQFGNHASYFKDALYNNRPYMVPFDNNEDRIYSILFCIEIIKPTKR